MCSPSGRSALFPGAARSAAAALVLLGSSCARTASVAPPVARRSAAVTVSAAFDEDPAEAFGSGIGLRAGAANFPAVTEESVRTRPSLGLYYHFAETAGRRFETGLDFSPSPVDLAENSYLLARLSYVGYLGERGLFYWTLGGGGIL